MMLSNLMRWVRVRGLTEGRMQKGRVEGLENDARDDAQRPQDYGFAANAVAGEGLKLEIGGHTVIIRLDRTAERPRLAAYEVSVWHKEGHNVTLRAGKIIEANCDIFRVNAAVKVELNTPTVNASNTIVAATKVQAPTVAAGGSLTVAGKEVAGHSHGNVQNGAGVTANF